MYCPAANGQIGQFVGSLLANRDVQRLLQHMHEVSQPASNNPEEATSTVRKDNEKFVASLNLQNYKSEDISVKISGNNTVIVEGKHGEKEVENGTISRQFVRKFVLPEGYDIEKVDSKLSSDGILTITAPKTVTEDKNCRTIPIKINKEE